MEGVTRSRNFATLSSLPPWWNSSLPWVVRVPEEMVLIFPAVDSRWPRRISPTGRRAANHPLDQPKLPRRSREILVSRIFELFYASAFSPPWHLFLLSSFLHYLLSSYSFRSGSFEDVSVNWRAIPSGELLG